MIAAAVIIAAVVLITSHQPRVKGSTVERKEASAAPRFGERECIGAGD
jgi:hypothetical protein